MTDAHVLTACTDDAPDGNTVRQVLRQAKHDVAEWPQSERTLRTRLLVAMGFRWYRGVPRMILPVAVGGQSANTLALDCMRGCATLMRGLRHAAGPWPRAHWYPVTVARTPVAGHDCLAAVQRIAAGTADVSRCMPSCPVRAGPLSCCLRGAVERNELQGAAVCN